MTGFLPLCQDLSKDRANPSTCLFEQVSGMKLWAAESLRKEEKMLGLRMLRFNRGIIKELSHSVV